MTINQDRILAFLEQEGAILRNDHFVFTSGRHGDAYINKDALFPRRGNVEIICVAMSALVQDLEFDVIIGPAAGGVAYAFELVRSFEPTVLRVYADKAGEGFVIKRGFEDIVRGKNVLAVEDIINSGKTIRALIDAIRQAGGHPVGVVAIANRGGVTAEDLQIARLACLVDFTMNSWTAHECPLCAADVPINTKVGHGAEFVAKQAAQNHVVN